MTDAERNFPNCDHDDCELQREEYCKLYERDPKHRVLLWELAKAAEDLINTDLDRAHIDYHGDCNGSVLSRSFEYDVAPDSTLYTQTCQEYLDVKRCDSPVTELRAYEIVTGWSVASTSAQHTYTIMCEGDNTVSATVSVDDVEGEHEITEYDVRQLTKTIVYYRQLAPVDPTYSPAS